MKSWIITISVDIDDDDPHDADGKPVTTEALRRVAGRIADHAADIIGDEVYGDASVGGDGVEEV